MRQSSGNNPHTCAAAAAWRAGRCAPLGTAVCRRAVGPAPPTLQVNTAPCCLAITGAACIVLHFAMSFAWIWLPKCHKTAALAAASIHAPTLSISLLNQATTVRRFYC